MKEVRLTSVFPPEAEAFSVPLSRRGRGGVAVFLEESLYQPIADISSRPSKRFRAQMVELGALLAAPSSKGGLNSEEQWLCQQMQEVIESIHAGSLVIDDIQDESQTRRGQPSLHVQYGLPLALNVGNYLYFKPFERIRSMGLSADTELRLYHLMHQTFHQAHQGQAMDLGVGAAKLRQEDVKNVVQAVLELKTGALMAMALVAGGVCVGAKSLVETKLYDFGCRFGMALQMFDDLGNLSRDKKDGKFREDLRKGRPSWIWWVAADRLNRSRYKQWVELVQSYESSVDNRLDDEKVDWFLKKTNLGEHAFCQANDFLLEVIEGLESAFPTRINVVRQVRRMAERLVQAYD